MMNVTKPRANYADGKLVPPKPGAAVDPKPVAGNVGTTITVGCGFVYGFVYELILALL